MCVVLTTLRRLSTGLLGEGQLARRHVILLPWLPPCAATLQALLLRLLLFLFGQSFPSRNTSILLLVGLRGCKRLCVPCQSILPSNPGGLAVLLRGRRLWLAPALLLPLPPPLPLAWLARRELPLPPLLCFDLRPRDGWKERMVGWLVGTEGGGGGGDRWRRERDSQRSGGGEIWGSV